MDKTISQVISEFLSFLSQAQSDYAFSQEEIVRLDMLTQDYLHKLELQDTNYRDRAKMATDLRQCRIDRRYHKDHVANLAPLVQCLTSDKARLSFPNYNKRLALYERQSGQHRTDTIPLASSVRRNTTATNKLHNSRNTLTGQPNGYPVFIFELAKQIGRMYN